MEHRKIIELWPSPTDMAADVGANPEAVRKWRQRNSIPANFWAAVARSAPAKKAGVTLEAIAMAASSR
jgi:hypothetical protein